MSVSYPNTSIVYVTDSLGQGSGVLISPDEVLTAAHVVYSTDSGVATDVQVTPGHDGAGAAPLGTFSGTVSHYNPVNDSGDMIALDQSQRDFAIIHLDHPVPEAGSMALGSNFTRGEIQLSGYPAPQGGALVSRSEYVYPDSSLTLLHGTPINGALYDSAGSSGGPVWTSNWFGLGTVYGLVSSSQYFFGFAEQANFVQLTNADDGLIESWMAQDDAGHAFAPAAPAALAGIDPVAEALRADYAGHVETRPALAQREARVLDAIDGALLYQVSATTDVDALVKLVTGDLVTPSTTPARDVAFLQGALYRYDGGGPTHLFPGLESKHPHLFDNGPVVRAAARQGYDEFAVPSQAVAAIAPLADALRSAPSASLALSWAAAAARPEAGSDSSWSYRQATDLADHAHKDFRLG